MHCSGKAQGNIPVRQKKARIVAAAGVLQAGRTQRAVLPYGGRYLGTADREPV